MKLIQDKKDSDKFKVESSSRKGHYYHVNIAQPFCDCPAFIITEMKRRGECKHIKAAKQYALSHASQAAEREDNSDKIISFVREKGEIDSIELINKFGEENINELIKAGELFEKHGRIKLL